jgi:hypothetical protein
MDYKKYLIKNHLKPKAPIYSNITLTQKRLFPKGENKSKNFSFSGINADSISIYFPSHCSHDQNKDIIVRRSLSSPEPQYTQMSPSHKRDYFSKEKIKVKTSLLLG